MKEKDVYVGQRVRIRNWDNMEKEFGLDSSGDIRCPANFITDMKYLCGQTATVKEISDKLGRVFLEFDKPQSRRWNYSPEMIEPLSCSRYEIIW